LQAIKNSIKQVKGSGENGRIIKVISKISNQLHYAPQQLQQQKQLQNRNSSCRLPPKVFVPAEKYLQEIKNSQMRKIIAKRLAESLFTAPHYN
jgi:pyruvate dehydrogenase E2 component (dihydrolipoamide acetyltransferase)